MRQSQTEIKAIEAELRSIRAEKSPRGRSVTLLEPGQQPEAATIAPTISPTIKPTAPMPATGAVKPQKTAQQRSVECFPVPNRYSQSRSQNSTQNHIQSHTQIDAVQTQLLAAIEQMQPGAVQQFKQVQSQFAKDASQQQRAAIRDLLTEKAQQINQLSTQQEMMILELMQISEQLEQNYQYPKTRSQAEVETVCEYLAAEVPYVETSAKGTLRLTTRAIDRIDDQAETAALAESLRRRSHQPNQSLLQALGRNLWRAVWGVTKLLGSLVGRVGIWITLPITRMLFGQAFKQASPAAPRRKIYRGSGRRATATETPLTLTQALILVIGSVLLRMLMDWVVAGHPVLWIPSILVMITPAMLAVYRSTITPQAGFVWSYRLFAILIGLLIGGRL